MESVVVKFQHKMEAIKIAYQYSNNWKYTPEMNCHVHLKMQILVFGELGS